jgi:hypothetical protein
MVDDFLYQIQQRYYPLQYSVNDAELCDMVISDLEYILLKNGRDEL